LPKKCRQKVFVALIFSWRELEEIVKVTLSVLPKFGKKFSLRFFSAGGNLEERRE